MMTAEIVPVESPRMSHPKWIEHALAGDTPSLEKALARLNREVSYIEKQLIDYKAGVVIEGHHRYWYNVAKKARSRMHRQINLFMLELSKRRKAANIANVNNMDRAFHQAAHAYLDAETFAAIELDAAALLKTWRQAGEGA